MKDQHSGVFVGDIDDPNAPGAVFDPAGSYGVPDPVTGIPRSHVDFTGEDQDVKYQDYRDHMGYDGAKAYSFDTTPKEEKQLKEAIQKLTEKAGNFSKAQCTEAVSTALKSIDRFNSISVSTFPSSLKNEIEAIGGYKTDYGP